MDSQTIFDIIQSNKLSSSDQVNEELSNLISLLLRDFVTSWFALLSPDKDLYRELIHAMSSIIQEIEKRLKDVDWVVLISQDLPNILKNHISDYKSCKDRMGTAYAGEKTFEELFFGLQSHVALQGDGSEQMYMRRVAEVIVESLLPASELQSDAIRTLVREILCNNVLLVISQELTDPDWLNETVVRVLSRVYVVSGS